MTGAWTFLSNHGHVLVALALDSRARLRDIAGQVGVTERAVQMIVADLVEAGVVEKRRAGRRNEYLIQREATFRHPLEAATSVGEFLDLVQSRRRP